MPSLSVSISIGYSTAVTWNAVASEGSHAKQHAFLWIILFSGLMVEPFIDALTEARYRKDVLLLIYGSRLLFNADELVSYSWLLF